MNCYYYSASTTSAQMRPVKIGRGQTGDRLQIWSACQSALVCADTDEAAQKMFEDSLRAQPKGENPREIKIHEIEAAPLVEKLLTEAGTAPCDWKHFVRQAWTDVLSLPPGFMEEGNWLDQDSIDSIKGSAFNIESLRLTLPEDIASSLSWAEDKQFYFLFIVLGSSAPATELWVDPEAEMLDEANTTEETPESEFGGALNKEPYPKLPPVESAVLVRARNSSVAVWLWRKYAANTPLKENPIRLVPWSGAIMGIEMEPPDGVTWG